MEADFSSAMKGGSNNDEWDIAQSIRLRVTHRFDRWVRANSTDEEDRSDRVPWEGLCPSSGGEEG